LLDHYTSSGQGRQELAARGGSNTSLQINSMIGSFWRRAFKSRASGLFGTAAGGVSVTRQGQTNLGSASSDNRLWAYPGDQSATAIPNEHGLGKKTLIPRMPGPLDVEWNRDAMLQMDSNKRRS